VGLNKTNTLKIEAKKAAVKLYVNDTYVTTTNDITFTNGEIGVAALGYDTPPAEAIFNNAKIWT
jgi:hypothetical protein